MEMKTCLFVIDVQASFTKRSYYSDRDIPRFLTTQNSLIEGAKESGIPVVRVLHHSPAGDESDPFAITSGLVRGMDGLIDFDESLKVYKTRHSALVGTGLDVWLVEQGIRQIIVSGIRTEQCCETTARHASDLGWKVIFVPEATMTWDMTLQGGQMLDANEIRSRTSAVLHGRFAEVLSIDEALKRASAT